MRCLFLILFSFFVVACSENDSVSFQPKDETDLYQLKETVFITRAKYQDSIKNGNLNKLLKDPIDLKSYKKNYGSSNSGGAGNNNRYNLPLEEGFLYQYMLFHELGNILPSHPSESELFHGFRITVFKYGTEVGYYSNDNEILMGIECRIDNTTLGDLNVFGLNRQEIIAKFSKPKYELGNNYIYQFEQNVLSIHFKEIKEDALENHKADWYKFIRLSTEIDLNKEIPEFLTTY